MANLCHMIPLFFQTRYSHCTVGVSNWIGLWFINLNVNEDDNTLKSRFFFIYILYIVDSRMRLHLTNIHLNLIRMGRNSEQPILLFFFSNQMCVFLFLLQVTCDATPKPEVFGSVHCHLLNIIINVCSDDYA